MAKQNNEHEKKDNYFEDMSHLIAKIDRLKLEPEERNISCLPIECPLEPCPGMCCDNNTCNPLCISEMPSVSHQHTQPSSLPDKRQFFKNFNRPNTFISSCTYLAQNSQCDLAEEATQIYSPPIAPQPNWETSVIEIPENSDYTPRLNYYCQQKPFRNHRPSNGPRK